MSDSSAMRYVPGAAELGTMAPSDVRSHFLVSGSFQPGAVTLHHIDLDRVVLGGAVPLDAPLRLTAPASIQSAYFFERREAGLLNVGGAGRVRVDDAEYALEPRDLLYIGKGAREVSLYSNDAATPAQFYVVSYPAHAPFPNALMRRGETQAMELGDAEHANRRRLMKYVHPQGIRSAQLVMGVTELQPGSVWNTIPPHTHSRRTEVYMYFGLPADAAIVHLLGQPNEVRSLIARDKDVVLSPGWSIHAGCGTTNYAFCWAMGGENQDFADMDLVSVSALR